LELTALVGSTGRGLSGPEMLPEQSFSGWEPKKLFTRLGEGERFEDCAWSMGFDSRKDGRTLIAEDFDRDGDVDLLMWNRVQPKLQLFENVLTGGNSVELELESKTGHREADGALVLVDGNGAFSVALTRGFVSAVSPRVHVGLGKRTEAKVKVKWRSGVTEDFGSVPAGGTARLVEGSGKAEVKQKFIARRAAPKPAWPMKVDEAVKGAKGPLLVQLFEQSCKPCQEEVPVLNALHKGGLPVTALGLHPAADIEKVRTAMKMEYPAQTLPTSVGEAFEGPTQGLSLPTVLVYGKDGTLARVVPGGKQLEPVLAELGLKP
jgi:thiol-disulfide isomerase/thioredoxin